MLTKFIDRISNLLRKNKNHPFLINHFRASFFALCNISPNIIDDRVTTIRENNYEKLCKAVLGVLNNDFNHFRSLPIEIKSSAKVIAYLIDNHKYNLLFGYKLTDYIPDDTWNSILVQDAIKNRTPELDEDGTLILTFPRAIDSSLKGDIQSKFVDAELKLLSAEQLAKIFGADGDGVSEPDDQ